MQAIFTFKYIFSESENLWRLATYQDLCLPLSLNMAFHNQFQK